MHLPGRFCWILDPVNAPLQILRCEFIFCSDELVRVINCLIPEDQKLPSAWDWVSYTDPATKLTYRSWMLHVSLSFVYILHCSKPACHPPSMSYPCTHLPTCLPT